MEGFKNTTRMKTFGDVAPQAYAKGGSVKSAAKVGKVMGEFAEGKLHSGSKTGPKVTNKKQAIAIGISEAKKAGAKGPMKKANGGEIVRMTDAERRASLEMPSRGMTPAEARALRATMAAKAAAPKRGPLIQPKNSNPMSPAEVRRLIEMDRPTNKMGAEAYKGGGKVGASKVPFAVKKVMRKAEGGAVNQPPPTSEIPTLYGADYDPSKPASPPPMPEMTPTAAPPPPLMTTPARPTPMPEISDTGSGYVPQPKTAQPAGPSLQSMLGGLDPNLVNRLLSQETATQPSMPDMSAVSAAAGRMANMYGTSPGPMPTMPNEPVMPMPKPAYGGFDEGSMPNLPRRRFTEPVMPEYTPEMFARDRAQNAARAADQAATLQAQREMAAQAQMDRGLGLDLGGRRNLAPSYGRNPYLPRS